MKMYNICQKINADRTQTPNNNTVSQIIHRCADLINFPLPQKLVAFELVS